MKGITPVILIALSVGVFYFYINPQYAQLEALQDEHQKYDDALEASTQLAELKDDLIERYNSFDTADLTRIQKFLPEQTDDVRLVLDIDTMARESNIVIEDVDVSDTPETDPVVNVRRMEDNKPYETLYVSFVFNATYQELINFVRNLEMSLRTIDVTKMVVLPNETIGGYDVEMTVQGYWVK
tara:strand:- start:324 stop:872 length:549 start_codon:yes stop_codon:yes gene_type:complete